VDFKALAYQCLRAIGSTVVPTENAQLVANDMDAEQVDATLCFDKVHAHSICATVTNELRYHTEKRAMRNRRLARTEGMSLESTSTADGEVDLDTSVDPSDFPGPEELGYEDEPDITDAPIDWTLIETIALDVPVPPVGSDTIPEVPILSTNGDTLHFSPRKPYTSQETNLHRLDGYLLAQEKLVFDDTKKRFQHLNAQVLLSDRIPPNSIPNGFRPAGNIQRWNESEGRWVPRLLPAKLADKFDQLTPTPIGQREAALKVCHSYERYLADWYRTTHIYMEADPVNEAPFPYAHEALAAIMGVAGCGKSYLLDFLGEYIEFVNRQWYNDHELDLPSTATVVMGAFLGSAAANIHGSTIHSLFGMSVHDTASTPSKLRDLAARHIGLRAQCPGCFVWEEIGCSPGADFVKRVDLQLRAIFNSRLPFGGLFVIFLGDFAQLDAPNLHPDQLLYPLPPFNRTFPISNVLANGKLNSYTW